MTRIIAGTHRGRRLVVPAGTNTRPTSDRVREAAFAAIISWGGDADAEVPLGGLSFLDCYAGSGAMAFEAASRGAASVMAVEADRAACGVLRSNAQTLGLPVDVRPMKVETLLATPAPRAFDMWWLDPPYAVETDALFAAIRTGIGQGWMCHDGLIVVERSSRSHRLDLSLCFQTTWDRTYGDTTLYFGMGGLVCE